MRRTATSTTEIVFPSAEVDGWLTVAEGHELARLAVGRIVLEIGSWCGLSTICMAQTAARVFALDTFQGDKDTGKQDTLAMFLANLARYGVRENVVPLVGDVEDIGPILAPSLFDMVFIDGSHDDQSVERDTLLALSVAKPSGVIAWHDWNMPSVQNGAERATDGKATGYRHGNLFVWERP